MDGEYKVKGKKRKEKKRSGLWFDKKWMNKKLEQVKGREWVSPMSEEVKNDDWDGERTIKKLIFWGKKLLSNGA